MKIKELTVAAVIPTAQYANLQPSITVEVNEDYDEAKAEAMKYISQFSQQYAEGDKAISSGVTVKKLKKMIPFIGDTELYFDKEEHAYCDKEGVVYESASTFAERFKYPFLVDAIVPKYAAKFEVEEQIVRDFWRAKAESSTTFGTSLHQALETYGKFNGLAKILDKPLGIHPTLIPIVEEFFKLHPEKNVMYEPMVVDTEAKQCGQIDRFVIVDEEKKICDIDDYKTNADLDKQNSPKSLKTPYTDLPNTPQGGYTIQLNVYRSIVEANGWTVRNMNLHHWAGEKWNTIKLDKVEI